MHPTKTRLPRILVCVVLLAGSCSSSPASQDSRTPRDVGRDQQSPADASDATPGDGIAGDRATVDSGPAPACPVAQCLAVQNSATLNDGKYQGAATTTGAVGCRRSYQLSSTQPLVASAPSNPRAVSEESAWPTLRSCNPLMDALYAVALEEVRQNSVSSISDGAFRSGKPMACKAGGCFETGKLWKYVWTRDTAYAVDLGLAALDPLRAQNSLEFKLSTRRDGSRPEIVQDTGTGGSYPISTDRVVWSMGARTLLTYLSGAARTQFRDRALAALANTITRDRAVAHDAADGLYRGEQSFLDWREQSYPAWVKGDPVQIGMSKALSTNAGHLSALELAEQLAQEKGDASATAQYKKWAAELRAAMRKRFFAPGAKLPGSFIPTTLDQAVAGHHDLLGSALAVLYEVATPAQASAMLAAYPHLARGAPVIWPQQQYTPIYHNRALWPFVTAYWLRAARKAKNDAAVVNGVNALVRGAALNLSNMENFEMLSGLPHVSDKTTAGDFSGPVVNSPRQLWSVAAYVSMVHDIIFGLQTSAAGIRFAPYLPATLRSSLFANASTLVLSALPFHGKRITVVLKLPASATPPKGGAYQVGSVKLNGKTVASGSFVAPSALGPDNLWEVTLSATTDAAASIKLVTKTADYRQLYGPRTPTISGVALAAGKLRVSFGSGGEAAGDITFNVYRDGQRVASALAGGSTSWSDPASSVSSPSHCYVVESQFTISGNSSQRSAPWCYWGPGSARVVTIGASSLTNTGGSGVTAHGKFHYQDWGDPGHKLVLSSFTAQQSGEHLLQLVAGNGAGPVNTGITCGLKALVVEQLGGGKLATGYVMMPHLGSWSVWKDTSFVRVKLSAGKSYRLTLTDDKHSVNMSAFAHFKQYTGGKGGQAGAFHRVNVAAIKVLYLGQ